MTSAGEKIEGDLPRCASLGQSVFARRLLGLGGLAQSSVF
jgi:hypothetical protein